MPKLPTSTVDCADWLRSEKGHGDKNSWRAYLVGIASINGTPKCSRRGQSRAKLNPPPMAISGLPRRVGSGRKPLNERPVLEAVVRLVNDVHGRETEAAGRKGPVRHRRQMYKFVFDLTDGGNWLVDVHASS